MVVSENEIIYQNYKEIAEYGIGFELGIKKSRFMKEDRIKCYGYDMVYQVYENGKFMDRLELHDGFKVYSVTAKMLKSEKQKHSYYIIDENEKGVKNHLKQVFGSIYPYITSVEECSEEESEYVLKKLKQVLW